MFWFHCGRCGRLFQDVAGESDTRLCPQCGFDPSLGIPEASAAPVTPAASGPGCPYQTGTPQRGKRTVRKRKNRHFMLKLIAGWSLVLAAIVFGARRMWPAEDPMPHRAPIVTTNPNAPSEEDLNLLQSEVPKCTEIFGSFIAAGVPEQRSQFVLNPVTTAALMTRFYDMNPIPQIDPANLSLTASSVLHIPQGRSIGTVWTSTDNKTYDVAFREENNEWRIDWEHFARFGDHPWPLFLAGNGPSEGEFRLLARERLAEERKNEPTISIVLYAPRFGQPGEPGLQSPEFLVSRASPEGRLITAAFRARKEDQRVFRSSLPDIDPEGMVRLRLRVKRTEVDSERRFEITQVLACHWYSLDDPGLAPAEPRPESGQ